jgi:hypothetical protein
MPLSKRDPANLLDILEPYEKVHHFPLVPKLCWGTL